MTANLSKENIKLINVSQDNVELIHDFLARCVKSQDTFRYYVTRNPTEAIKNHIKTIVITYMNIPVGYGHLDREGAKTWLGICVTDDFIGIGVGKTIMNELLSDVDYPVCLSVDSKNTTALSLYKKFNFTISKVNNDTVFMERL